MHDLEQEAFRRPNEAETQRTANGYLELGMCLGADAELENRAVESFGGDRLVELPNGISSTATGLFFRAGVLRFS